MFRDFKILKKDEKNNSVTDEDKLNAYDYLAILALIRNFSMHPIKLRKNRLQPLFNKAKNELSKFKNDFVKTNKKYLYILKDVYNNKEIFQDFFKYMTFDEKKNLGLSVEKITKNIMNEMNLNLYVDNERYLSEFRNKFKILLSFDVYNWFKGNILTYVKELKECENENQKEILYKTYSRKYKSFKCSSIDKIINAIKRYLGEQDIKEFDIEIDFEVDEYIKNDFINCIYVFSIFLSKKDANSMYSDLINKIDNIKELRILANKAEITINEKTFNLYNNTIFDLDDNTTPTLDDFENVINQLRLLKNLRLRNIKTFNNEQKKNLEKNALKQIYDCFDSGEYNFEKFDEDLKKDEKGDIVNEEKSKKKKPLKNIFRNDVYNSKYYQYLVTHSKTSICKKIMQNKSIVRFALYDILGLNIDNEKLKPKLEVDKSHEGMHKFLSKLYHKYRKDEVEETDKNYLLNLDNVEELVNVLNKFTLKKLSNSIFNDSNVNYTSILKLYFMVCYLVVRGVMRINSSYFIAIQDYENIYKLIPQQDKNNKKVEFDFSVIDHYIDNAPNKKSKSYKKYKKSKKHKKYKGSRSYVQLKILLEKPYIEKLRKKIKEFREKKYYDHLLTKYRNTVAHCTLLCDDKIWDVEFKNIKSYFGIYQTLMQSNTSIRKKCEEVWGDLDEYFKLDDDKSYSTKLTIAMNIIFAYNMSRFNNNTIEKYAMKKND